MPDKVFVAEPDTETAQQEVLDLIRTHLAGLHFSEHFQQLCKGILICRPPGTIHGRPEDHAAAEGGVPAGAGKSDTDAPGGRWLAAGGGVALLPVVLDACLKNSVCRSTKYIAPVPGFGAGAAQPRA